MQIHRPSHETPPPEKENWDKSREEAEQQDQKKKEQMQRKKKFQSRADIMKELKFPDNNENLVVIPSNNKGTGFMRTCYIEEILEGVIPQEEFQAVVDAASKLVSRVYTKKRLADAAGIDKRVVLISIISLLLAFAFLVLINQAISKDSILLEICSYCSLGGSMCLILPLALYECFRNSDDKRLSFNQLVKRELDVYFQKINQTTYASRGLEWAVDEGHYWIELRIHLERENRNSRGQTISNFNTNERFIPSDGQQFQEFNRNEPEREDDLSVKNQHNIVPQLSNRGQLAKKSNIVVEDWNNEDGAYMSDGLETDRQLQFRERN